jgi:hypothetical protein
MAWTGSGSAKVTLRKYSYQLTKFDLLQRMGGEAVAWASVNR